MIPFKSSVDISFWSEIARKKLSDQKLSEEPYISYGSVLKNEPNVILFTSEIMDDPDSVSLNEIPVKGIIINLNTIENFRDYSIDKLEFSIDKLEFSNNKDSFSEKNLFNFILICFCDLKKHIFYYRFVFPTIELDFELKSRPSKISFLNNSFLNKGVSIVRMKNSLINMSELEPKNDKTFYFPYSFDSEINQPLYNFLVYLSENLIFDYEKEFITIFTNKTEMKIKFKKKTEKKIIELKKSIENSVDLSLFMDPKKLSEESSNLNLQLMKWREWPEIDLDSLQSKKCLIIGAGTLGSSVARTLLGYGFRHINFVDNGVVSYSNPARQSLYLFEDSQKEKAHAAAESLLRIFPNVSSKGYQITVPDPSSIIINHYKDTINQIKELDSLIESHDLIFLLTDTRESRWLPTLLSIKHDKLLMNSALSFDSYVVFRHPTKLSKHGCYFCNDLVAPRNSRKNRTMDQQCTVTRPGLSDIAGSTLVSLLVSFLNDKNKDIHQIRGSLKDFSTEHIKTTRFSDCLACSEKVFEQSFDEILECLKNPDMFDINYDITDDMMIGF